MQQDTFYQHQGFEEFDFHKNGDFISFAGPSETGKSKLIYSLLQNGTFHSKIDSIHFFNQYFQPLLVNLKKGIENLEFVQGVNFEFIYSL